MNFRRIILAIGIASIVSVSTYAQDAADPRVAEALDSLGIKYSVNSSNNYKVVYRMDNDPDRSHLVFVVSKTSIYRSVEIREIWSIAAILDEYPDSEMIHRLLSMNSTTKIGAWAIEESEDGEIWLMYTTKILAGLKPEELKDTIYFVAEVCDEMEAELVGDDNY
ncbi:MAG: hypothetical protein CVV47_15505 [Spirochaetae bacterium HGW-Spirochaetae-3]|jgi:hypothetical protein|nr:MAG: hypothetical protein CVV47_15505 [Spirochaetae bacterium HGW-Spirochaetae-3]